MRTTLLILGLFGLATSYAYAAGEADIRLKEAAGKPLVAGYCSQCHSLDYIEMNAPFLKHANWQATVNKMIKVMGAPIPEGDVPAIVEYLTRNYGVE